MKIGDLKLTLSKVCGNAELVLDSVAEWREYHEDKSKERRFLGHKYTVKCFDPFVKIDVKIPAAEGTAPVITNTEVQKSSKPVAVTVVDGGNTLSFSGSNLFAIDLSLNAERISILSKAQ